MAYYRLAFSYPGTISAPTRVQVTPLFSLHEFCTRRLGQVIRYLLTGQLPPNKALRRPVLTQVVPDESHWASLLNTFVGEA
jgi:hypothetical protein